MALAVMTPEWNSLPFLQTIDFMSVVPQLHDTTDFMSVVLQFLATQPTMVYETTDFMSVVLHLHPNPK